MTSEPRVPSPTGRPRNGPLTGPGRGPLSGLHRGLLTGLRYGLRTGLLTGLLLLGLAGCGVGDSSGVRGAPVDGCPGISGQRVRWIVPYTPGGGYDVHSRLLQPFMERATGARITVENRPGAGGRVGARAIRDARPDGRTLGIVNAPSLLISDLSEGITGLHPLEGFEVIGRIGFAESFWAASATSGLRTIEEVIERSSLGPLLFGITDVGSTGFVSVSGAADLLGLDVEYITGYPGNRELSLGLMRDEFDLAGFTFDSVLDRVESGDLIPILQIAGEPFSFHPALVGVPVLAGPEGVAAQAALARGEDPGPALARAEALVRIFQAGRLVVAPRGMPPEISACLSSQLAQVMASPDFAEAAAGARRAFAHEGPAVVARILSESEEDRRLLSAVVLEHIARARGDAR